MARRSSNPEVTCPECGRGFKETYLDTHRRKQHGVRKVRGKKNSEVAGPLVSAGLPEVPFQEGPLASLGLDLILTQIYPKGIPASKIPTVIRWLDASMELQGR